MDGAGYRMGKLQDVIFHVEFKQCDDIVLWKLAKKYLMLNRCILP